MNPSLKNTVAIIASLIGLILVFYLRTIVAYVLVSVVLALIGSPVMKILGSLKIKGKALPDAIKSGITIIFLLVFFSGIFALFVPLVMEEAKLISTIDLNSVSTELEEPIRDLENWLKDKHLLKNQSSIDDEIVKLVNLTSVKTIFNSALGLLGNSLIALFSILFITFFFLKEKQLYNDFILALTPTSKSEQLLRAMKNAKRLLSRYFIGIILQIFTITIIVSAGLSLLGIDNAILIGFLAGLINVIPYMSQLLVLQ